MISAVLCSLLNSSRTHLPGICQSLPLGAPPIPGTYDVTRDRGAARAGDPIGDPIGVIELPLETKECPLKINWLEDVYIPY